MCNENVGLECTTYNQDIYSYLTENEVEINFICQECKETLPDLRNLLEITMKQKELREDIEKHDTRITNCEVQIEDMKKEKEDITLNR